jgi:SAM-dependent methyltransferase
MEPVEGAREFRTTGNAYDGFMGRYSRMLAGPFADVADIGAVKAGDAVLDVGCGPGALTGVLVDRIGAASVSAVDPSPPFVAECSARYPEVDVQLGRGEALPFPDERFDVVLSQLVLHFVTDGEQVGREFLRVLRRGGIAAACVWDFAEGMQMLRSFWDAALELDPGAPDEARTLKYGGPGEIADLLVAAGFGDVREQTLDVGTTYEDFDELWAGFLAGIGPAGAYCVGLEPAAQNALRDGFFRRLGSPAAGFSLTARARCASGRKP